MKHFRIFVVITLCVSLFVNYSALVRLEVLESRVAAVSNNQNQILNSVNSQTGNIRSVLNDLKEEQSWVSPVSMTTKTTDIDQGKADLHFEWQVKEFKNNSEVVFNYKHGDVNEYTPLTAEHMGSGLFEMTIPIEVKIEPEWGVVISDSNNTGSDMQEKIKEEKIKMENEKNFRISYFITVTHNDTMKSSEINQAYIGNVGGQHYGFLETFININKDNYFSVTVTGVSINNEPLANLQEVSLKKYRDGKLLDEEKLITSDNSQGDMPIRENARTFYTETSKEILDYNSLVVKVTYNDGATFENEIYSR